MKLPRFFGDQNENLKEKIENSSGRTVEFIKTIGDASYQLI